MSTFSTHLMMSLYGDNLSYMIGSATQQGPGVINSVDLKSDSGKKIIQDLGNEYFSSITFSYYQPIKTLIPQGIFKKENQLDYLSYNYSDIDANALLEDDYVRQINANLIYIQSKEVKSLSKIFPSMRMRHAVSILLEAQLRSTVANEQTEVTVYSSGEYIEIIISDHGKLLFNNNFKVYNPEDYTYYVIYIMDMLGISTKNTLVRVCGSTDVTHYNLLKEYCAQASFHKFGYDLNSVKNFSDQDYAKQVVLLNQYQCV